MKEKQLAILRRLKNDFSYYSEKCLKIVDKETGLLVPFKLNRAQQYIHDQIEDQLKRTGKVRKVIVKGRQQGCSTYVEGRFFHKTTLNPGNSAFILAHIADSTNHLFGMAKKFYESAPPPILPTIDKMNERRLEFNSIGSSYAVGTAGSAQIGRGTTVRLFHGCLSADSLVVLADGGTKPISDVTVADQVITSSGDAAFVSVKSYTGQKEVFEISTWLTNETIKASKDHKILTDRGLLKLSDITEKDYIQLPDIEIRDRETAKGFWLELKQRPQNGGSQPRNFEEIPLDYDHGYLFGYYLAEGHVKKQWNSDRCCQTSFAYHEDEIFIENILPLLERYGTSVKTKHIAKQHKRITSCYGTFLAELLNSWFGRVGTKNIPRWVFKTNKKFVLGIIEGYFAGDGSKTSIGRVRAPSVHERISRQLKRLILAVTPGVAGLHVYDRERYGVPCKKIHTLSVNGRAYDELYGNPREEYQNERFKTQDGKRFVKIRSIQSVGEEETWDIEVAHPDHNFETPIGIVSNSEVAFWEKADDISAGVLQAVPNAEGTEVILESTCNGAGNWFHTMAMLGLGDADSEFETIFVPWYWQPEYRLTAPQDFCPTDEESDLIRHFELDNGQLYWRRRTIATTFGGDVWRFKREYPNTVEEGFLASGEALIHASYVLDARKCSVQDRFAPVVGGCDPARDRDRTVMVLRQGRQIVKMRKFETMDEMTCAGWIAQDIERYDILKYFVDVGCGYGTVDRLKELGFGNIVMGVHFGSTAMESEIYGNKSAEMAAAVKSWFEEGGVNIPDSDELQADLVSIPPLEAHGSRGRLALPPKKELRKALGRSPDFFDALKLTFAYPVASRAAQNRIKRVTTDVRRPNSPLGTVRDFNRVGPAKTKIFKQDIKII